MDIHRNLLVGLVYSFLSFAFIIVNVLFFVTVSRHVEFQTNTYRIIKVMIIGCLMQLLSHLAGGVMTMSKNTFDHHVERFLGALIQSGWFLYQGASLTLAVDRVIIFRSKSNGRHSSCIRWIFISFAVLISVFYLVILLIPGFGFTYSQYLNWFYDDKPGSKSMLTVEKILDFLILSGILLLYIVVFLLLLKMRKTGNSTISSVSVELRILLTAVVTFVYECTYLAFFFWGSNIVKDETVNSVTTSLLWIVDCGVFAQATITINRFKHKEKMFKIRKKSHMVTTITKTIATRRLSRQPAR